MSLVIPLLAFAIRRAGRTAVALEARGLSPDGPRTVMNAPRFQRSDIFFIIAALGTIALCGAAVVSDFRLRGLLPLPQVGHAEPA
jgi:energy-coupling factor transport system permease protein